MNIMRYIRRFFAAVLRFRSSDKHKQLELDLWPRKRR